MDYRTLYHHLISQLLSGVIDRKTVSLEMAREVPIDLEYGEDKELLENCEWALRHANEPDYFTSDAELSYYLRCLERREKFSVAERDRRIKGITG